MHVLAHRPETGLAVPAADADDRELAVEGDELLGELVHADRLRLHDTPLALAVVAEPPLLDECRQPRLLERAEPRGRDPQRAEELLLVQPVLAALERRDPRDGAHPGGRLDGDVLELVRDDVGAPGEPLEPVRVVVGPDDELPDRARAGVGRGIEEAELQAERQPREPEHASQLPAADAGDERHPGTELTRPDRGSRARSPSAPRGTGGAGRRSRRPRRRGSRPRGALR